jgi:hypothetical protein
MKYYPIYMCILFNTFDIFGGLEHTKALFERDYKEVDPFKSG